VRGWAVAGLVAILLVALQIFLIGPAIRHVLPAGLYRFIFDFVDALVTLAIAGTALFAGAKAGSENPPEGSEKP
jgi:hypothetical protein